MMCYQDRTFCRGDGCAKHALLCTHALTPEIEQKAKAAGLMIAQYCEPKELPCWKATLPNPTTWEECPSLL